MPNDDDEEEALHPDEQDIESSEEEEEETEMLAANLPKRGTRGKRCERLLDRDRVLMCALTV